MLVKQSVHEAILDARNGNIPSLGVVHTEGTIGAVFVGVIHQFTMHFFEISFQVVAEVFEFCCALFSTHKSLPTMPEGG